MKGFLSDKFYILLVVFIVMIVLLFIQYKYFGSEGARGMNLEGRIEKRIKLIIGRIEDLKKELNKFKTHEDRINNHINHLRNERRVIRYKYLDRKNRIAEFRNKIHKLNENEQRITAKINDLKNQQNSLKTQENYRNNRNSRNNNSRNNNSRNNNSRNNNSRNNIQNNNQNNIQNDQKKAEIAIKIDQLQKNLMKLKMVEHRLNDQLQKLRIVFDKQKIIWKKKVQEINRKISNLKKQRSHLKSREDGVKGRLNDLYKRKEKKERELENLRIQKMQRNQNIQVPLNPNSILNQVN